MCGWRIGAIIAFYMISNPKRLNFASERNIFSALLLSLLFLNLVCVFETYIHLKCFLINILPLLVVKAKSLKPDVVINISLHFHMTTG